MLTDNLNNFYLLLIRKTDYIPNTINNFKSIRATDYSCGK